MNHTDALKPTEPPASGPLTIAYITAGGAGMFCGSCMRDNTVARAMFQQGHDMHLIPTYTPITVDEQNVSSEQIFYGGINVYLEQVIPGYRFLPDFLTHWLDRPSIIKLATSRGIQTNPKQLGALTLSMLRGDSGNQRKEAKRLAQWIGGSIQPHVVNLSNMLIAGCVPTLRQHTSAPIVVTLQGDDIFLNDLPEPFRELCFQEIRKLVKHVDAFVVFSRYYADFMHEYFGIPLEKFRYVTLGIDTEDLDTSLVTVPKPIPDGPPVIGYLARLAPEKGLHHLVDAFIALRQAGTLGEAKLKIAGWLGKSHAEYAETQFNKLRMAGLAHDFEYVGSVDRREKIQFLRSLDLLSVPTVYRDPKGLFLLEALAAGVPVVQPAHGAFPELLEATGGGLLVPPEDPQALAGGIVAMLSDRDSARAKGHAAAQRIRDRLTSDEAAKETVQVYRDLIAQRQEDPELASPAGDRLR